MAKKVYVVKKLIAIGPGSSPNALASASGYVASIGPQTFEGISRQDAETKIINFLRSKHNDPHWEDVYELPAVNLSAEDAIEIPEEILEQNAGDPIDFTLINRDLSD